MWPWIAAGAALLVIIIGIWVLYARLQKEAMELVARRYEVPKKYTWAELGIPKALVEEWEAWDQYCRENGIDPKPMSPIEEKDLTDKILEGLTAHWQRLCPLYDLKKDDVFRADARFIQGTKRKSGETTYVIPETSADHKDNAHDPTRAGALFVVENSEVQEDAHLTYIVTQWVDIYARRLNNDGSYNPNGENIRFSVGDIEHWDWNSQIEVIGQMNSDRTKITLVVP